MGYACPVCGHPQADARHLANHLAFTALARGGDHETWLEDRVPEWESLDETALADRVVDHADTVEFPQVFEDTTRGSADDHSHDHGSSERGHESSEQDHDPAEQDHDQGRASHDHTGNGDGTRDPRLDAARSQAAEGVFSDEAADVLAEARELTRKRRENAAGGAEAGGSDEGETGDDSEDASADESETE